MSDPYVGEIRMAGMNFAPVGWAFCDGSLQSIAENETLFQLIGTTYGGDGQSTFGLPDLRGRIPLHMGRSPVSGTTYQISQTGGAELVTIAPNQYPLHTHPWRATSAAAQNVSPGGFALAASTSNFYSGTAPSIPMAASMTSGNSGGNLPHENRMPYLGINFIISLFGIFPTQ